MKKNILLFTCFLCLSFAGLQARAQNPADQAASQTGQAAGDAETKAKVQAKLQQLATELNLTDDQKTQIKPILQGEVKELQGIKADASMSPEQKKSKATEIRSTSKSQIGAILTPEQQKKLAAMKEAAADDQ